MVMGQTCSYCARSVSRIPLYIAETIKPSNKCRGCRKSAHTRMGFQHASIRVWSMLIRSMGSLIPSIRMGNMQ